MGPVAHPTCATACRVGPEGSCCSALGLPLHFFVEDSPLLPLDNFLHVTAAHQTLTHDSLRRIMASTSLTNQVKEDVAFVRKLLREGRAPSFLEMLLRPAYAFRRVPHISCRAVANPILCCSCAYANLMCASLATRRIPWRQVKMKLMNQILAQEPHEPQAAQRVESRSAVDARNVNLGDPGAMANVCSPSNCISSGVPVADSAAI